VQTSLSILQDYNSKSNYDRRCAANAIETIFGSVEIAAIYIVNTMKNQITQYIASFASLSSTMRDIWAWLKILI
jgi:hypothetical protein